MALVAVVPPVVTMAARGETGTGVWKKLCWGRPVPLGVVNRGCRTDNVVLDLKMEHLIIKSQQFAAKLIPVATLRCCLCLFTTSMS